ncbi:MAG: Asp-tRNA(Asn)/Glu-tRNA(Gln) amidotransferase subunit GatA [Bryobacteraceae bacterium]
MDTGQLSIAKIQKALRAGRVSARELAQEALRTAREQNPASNAWLTLAEERALRAAGRVDAALERNEDPGPLAGVPVAVKDNIATRGVRTTCGSRLLEHFVPPYDATAVERLERAGAVLIGKTNCDEFAMGSSNENSAFGPVRNPAAPDRVPGGSSGGSAAAVAQGAAVAALGSDTGGSIRQPASFCGVVGLSPTYGRVSRYGLVAFASSLDRIGPLAHNVRDAARILHAMAGRDERDSTSAFAPVPDYETAMTGEARGLRVGLPREYFEDLGGGTAEQMEKAKELLASMGCRLSEISLPHTAYAIPCYYVICTAEASSNLARYDGVRYTWRAPQAGTLKEMYEQTRGRGFGTECKRRIMLGTYVLSAGYYDAYYLKAQQVRTLITRDFLAAFGQVDVIAAPVSPFPAFRLGEKLDDPLQMYLSDIFTITASLAGLPAMSVPCGKTSEGLPVGLQLIGPHFGEPTLFRLGEAFERAGGASL